jgi:hypothetical protein
MIGFFTLFGSCSARIAPLRQAERHAWHSWHKLCSICATPFTSRIAPDGQTSTHSPQPVQRDSFTYTTVTTFFLYLSDMNDLFLNRCLQFIRPPDTSRVLNTSYKQDAVQVIHLVLKRARQQAFTLDGD